MAFNKYPLDLFSAVGFRSKVTEKVVEMNPTMKNIYLHMVLSWAFHIKNGRAYYESYDQIGRRCGVNGRTVMRAVTVLEEHGVMKVERVRGRGVTKNVYKGIERLDLVHEKDVDMVEEPANMVATNEYIPEWVMEDWI